MTSYDPPIENLPIFDPIVFTTGQEVLTYADAVKSFLKFPIAQGTETFSAINVGGTATFSSAVNLTSATQNPTSSAVQPASNNATTIIPTTAWTQTAITAGTCAKITTTDINTDATYYPVFTNASGSSVLSVDATTGPFTINPSTGAMNLATTIKLRPVDNSVAIGNDAGATQSSQSVAIGANAGKGNQGQNSVAVGYNSCLTSQGNQSVAIGAFAGGNQATQAVAIGLQAGNTNQGIGAVAIGSLSGFTTQGGGAVAIGNNAGQAGLGANAIAIGNNACIGSGTAGSICLNASGSALNSNQTGLFINPIRGVALGIGIGRVFYNSATFELQYSTS